MTRQSLPDGTGRAVGVVGLGAMGGPAAAALATRCPTWGTDPVGDRRDAAAAAGVHATDDPHVLVGNADVVVLSLPGPAHVLSFARDVVGSAARAGSVVVDLSTIDPGTARQVSELCAARGVEYLDAPVLGRPERCGSWTLAAGGPERVVTDVRELLCATIASDVVHIGGVGAGSVVKLMNNLMFGAINTVTAEVLATVARAGVDPGLFVRTVDGSGAATVSNLFRDIGPKMASGDYTPTFSVTLLEKDNRLAVQLAESVGAPTWIGTAVAAVNTLAVEDGHGAHDTSAVIESYWSRCAADE